MEFKQFIKPTVLKVSLAIAVFLILSFLPIVPATYVYKCVGCVFTEYHGIWYTLFEWGYKTAASYIVIVLEAVVSYLISAFVLSIKPKKKKK
jgi:hypothetical protein